MHEIISKEKRNSFRNAILPLLDSSVRYYYPKGIYALVDINGNVYNSYNGKQYKTHLNRNGYPCLNVMLLTGKKKAMLVHRIVAETFLAYLPDEYYEVNHIDGNKLNNSIYNLEWMTRQENLQHARDMKLFGSVAGENNPKCKFKNKDIEDMRELHRLGFSNKEIRKSYKINRNYLTAILKGKKR
jgi:hypothetical protein